MDGLFSIDGVPAVFEHYDDMALGWEERVAGMLASTRESLEQRLREHLTRMGHEDIAEAVTVVEGGGGLLVEFTDPDVEERVYQMELGSAGEPARPVLRAFLITARAELERTMLDELAVH